MKCPMKMREYHMDGHSDECDANCAWLVVDCSDIEPRYYCAVVTKGAKRPVNYLKEQKNEQH